MLDPDGTEGEESVADLLDLDDEESRRPIATWQEGFTWLRRPAHRRVAAVQGYAVGAGFQLALACDLRVLADDARFSMREPVLGPGARPDGNKAAGRVCWLLPGPGDLRHHPVGRADEAANRAGDGRRPRRGAGRAVADLVAALTAPVHGAVERDQGAAAERGRPRPRGPAARRAGGAGTPVPRAGRRWA